MPVSGFRRIATLFALLLPAAVTADPFRPLPTYNQSPLNQIFGLPTPAGARLLEAGKRGVRLVFEASSHFIIAENPRERLYIDGETHRTAVILRYGGAAMEWGVELPYVTHSGGFLDGFIDDWHDFFGLPDGGRGDAAPDRIRYLYARNGAEQLRLTSATRGIGDVRLLAAWPLGLRASDAALRASLKLPTGDALHLHGSGAADLAVWVEVACRADACRGAWRWNAGFGALAAGRGDVLREQQRRIAAFGGLGAGWRIAQPVVLKAELRGHTSFYDDTALTPLDEASVQLILGGTWLLSKGTAVDMAVSEDIRVTTAPDVSLLVSVRADF